MGKLISKVDKVTIELFHHWDIVVFLEEIEMAYHLLSGILLCLSEVKSLVFHRD